MRQHASKMQIRDDVSHGAAVKSDVMPAARLVSGPQSCLCQFEVNVGGAEEGMSVSLLGSHELLGEWDVTRAVPMILTPQATFAASMHLPADTDLEYRYLVKSAPRWDAVERGITVSGHLTAVRHLLDHDTPPPGLRFLPSLSLSPGPKCRKGTHDLPSSKHICRFRLELPMGCDLQDGQWAGVVGDDRELGDWELSRCLPMQAHQEQGKTIWSAEARVAGDRLLAYKYVIVTSPRWEPRAANRCLSLPPHLAEWQVAPSLDLSLDSC